MEQIDSYLTPKKFKIPMNFHNERVAKDIWVHGLDSPPVYIVYDDVSVSKQDCMLQCKLATNLLNRIVCLSTAILW